MLKLCAGEAKQFGSVFLNLFERAKGIEPSSYPWEGYILPVYYARRNTDGLPFVYKILLQIGSGYGRVRTFPVCMIFGFSSLFALAISDHLYGFPYIPWAISHRKSPCLTVYEVCLGVSLVDDEIIA